MPQIEKKKNKKRKTMTHKKELSIFMKYLMEFFRQVTQKNILIE